MGFHLTETTIDSKGRIVIPEEVRKQLRLTEGTKIRVTVAENDHSIIMIKPNVEPNEFIKRTKGVLKEGSAAGVADPLRLKELWAGP